MTVQIKVGTEIYNLNALFALVIYFYKKEPFEVLNDFANNSL